MRMPLRALPVDARAPKSMQHLVDKMRSTAAEYRAVTDAQGTIADVRDAAVEAHDALMAVVLELAKPRMI